MELKIFGTAAAWGLAGLGCALVLMGLVPVGSADANIAFWVAAIGFDRLADYIPKAADLWVAGAGLAAIAIGGALLLIDPLTRRTARAKEEAGLRLSRMEQKLLSSKWLLVYDPQQNLSKILSFNADGTVGEGRNQNENTWAVSGRYLEIFRESGLLHNRFEFHESGEKLNFARDPKAIGTKGQHMQRAP